MRRGEDDRLLAFHGAEDEHNARSLADIGAKSGRTGRQSVTQEGIVDTLLTVAHHCFDLYRNLFHEKKSTEAHRVGRGGNANEGATAALVQSSQSAIGRRTDTEYVKSVA